MEAGNYFFSVFVLTILATRFFVFFYPISSPTLYGFRTHHYMFGLVLAPLGFFLGNLTIFAAGTSLFIDEFTYILIGGKSHEDNYSWQSLFGTAIFVFLVFLFKEKFLIYFS
ncbi:hypothetical protein HY837_01960 [archaeon]|nr:hypothetical protein [archaeon]